MAMVQLRSREGGGLGAVPKPEIKLKSCPTKRKLLLSISAIFTEAIQMTLLCFKMHGNNLFQEKTINQDIFAVVPMLICV